MTFKILDIDPAVKYVPKRSAGFVFDGLEGTDMELFATEDGNDPDTNTPAGFTWLDNWKVIGVPTVSASHADGTIDITMTVQTPAP